MEHLRYETFFLRSLDDKNVYTPHDKTYVKRKFFHPREADADGISVDYTGLIISDLASLDEWLERKTSESGSSSVKDREISRLGVFAVPVRQIWRHRDPRNGATRLSVRLSPEKGHGYYKKLHCSITSLASCGLSYKEISRKLNSEISLTDDEDRFYRRINACVEMIMQIYDEGGFIVEPKRTLDQKSSSSTSPRPESS